MSKYAIICKGGKTKQSFREECDINVLMKRFQKTGKLPDNIKGNPVFVNLGDSISYQESLNRVIIAEDAFKLLPAEVRKRFKHNPYELVDFCSKEENREEMIKLGLIKPEKVVLPEKETIPNANQ